MKCMQCDKEFGSPFCPNCGMRLTDNEFMGQSVQALDLEREDAQRDFRNADSILRDTVERHKREIEGPQKSLENCRETCRKISEAMKWARENDIVHPDMRR